MEQFNRPVSGPELERFTTAEAADIKERLDDLEKVLPTTRSRFFPSVLEMAGQQLSVEELLAELVDAMITYAKTTSNLTFTLHHMVRELPRYVAILIPPGEQRQVALEQLEIILPDMLRAAQDSEADSNDSLEAEAEQPAISFDDLPKDIKRMLKTPPNRRSEAVRERLNGYQAGLGEVALRHLLGPRRRRVPSQQKIAEMQARLEQSKGTVL